MGPDDQRDPLSAGDEHLAAYDERPAKRGKGARGDRGFINAAPGSRENATARRGFKDHAAGFGPPA
jgi:hypothetical protein